MRNPRSDAIAIYAPMAQDEHTWLRNLWQAEWGGASMVSHGDAYHLSELLSLVARRGQQLVGAATYRMDEDSCELMSINAVESGIGVGTELLTAIERETIAAGKERVWLITSNDNLDAMRFYQRRGYLMVGVHVGAVDDARRIKPTIPLIGHHGIEIHDEVELSKTVTPGASVR